MTCNFSTIELTVFHAFSKMLQNHYKKKKKNHMHKNLFYALNKNTIKNTSLFLSTEKRKTLREVHCCYFWIWFGFGEEDVRHGKDVAV